MKKKIVLLLLTLLLWEIDIPSVEARSVVKTNPEFNLTTKSQTAFGRKRPRRKRGFLWGLFKKKNPCGCPSH